MNSRIKHVLFIFAIIVLTATPFTDRYAAAQTCSCAGAPLLGSQNTSSIEAGALSAGITYQFNQIRRLFAGTERLVNDSAERNTQSMLLELNYGITDRLSLSGTLSYVRKERLSGLGTPGSSRLSDTNGVGDGMMMLRYTIIPQTLWNRYQLAAGIGAKAPVGNTSHTNSSGLLFNADMQSGTGAWDGVFWGYGAVSLLPFSTANISLATSYRLTGQSERFGRNDRYRFGNEFTSAMEVSNGITDRLAYRIGMEYRSTSSDRLNDFTQPNTGGKWVSATGGVSYGLSDRISASISGRIPVYQYLKGTQPTTSYTASVSLFYTFNRQKNTFIHARN